MYDNARANRDAVDLEEVLDWLDTIEGRYREHGADKALETLREFRSSLDGKRPSRVRVAASVDSYRVSWLQRVERILAR